MMGTARLRGAEIVYARDLVFRHGREAATQASIRMIATGFKTSTFDCLAHLSPEPSLLFAWVAASAAMTI
jgi:hypothetical protein